ncbi:MAG: bifunctional 4-hydroxy-2-oxoglutarate aldolase/2-dehydro-3-deoxy-phosphogluconate aldolase [Verrucomicrobiales bacterium]
MIQEICRRLENPGVIAVVRAKSFEQVLPLTEALIRGGVVAIEITMTTPRAIEAIAAARKTVGESALIGVGTILDDQTCQQAIDAGAQFVVSPVVKPSLVQIAHSAQCPIMLGAYTPTEAQTACEAGADYVKLFPAEGLGATYVKSLRAPFPHLKIVPTGGVDLTTITAFFQAGCSAVGVGSSLTSAEILNGGKWDELTSLAVKYVQAAIHAKKK